ncbi:hypothetical protein LIS77_06585 [Cytobacillus firmus]|uniref:hypothetical protein n=1 Tax=Cytobacillus firmus TaxID=1399 RepID=UPI00207A06C2|nr:hypothetical protein [Cytobacillus firmus]USK40163.1 hypothetical protein LIS77_06585 [Cytobacillus firmus]
MKFADHLSKEHIQQFNQLRRIAVNINENPKNQEKLSRRDWEELMGKHRDTYKRVNGAIRRK